MFIKALAYPIDPCGRKTPQRLYQSMCICVCNKKESVSKKMFIYYSGVYIYFLQQKNKVLQRSLVKKVTYYTTFQTNNIIGLRFYLQKQMQLSKSPEEL